MNPQHMPQSAPVYGNTQGSLYTRPSGPPPIYGNTQGTPYTGPPGPLPSVPQTGPRPVSSQPQGSYQQSLPPHSGSQPMPNPIGPSRIRPGSENNAPSPGVPGPGLMRSGPSPVGGFGPVAMGNGPAPPHPNMQVTPQPHGTLNPQGSQVSASTNQMIGQMAGMTVSGASRPPMQNHSFGHGPVAKPGFAGPGGHPGIVNGNMPTSHTGPPPQQGFPTQYVNGSMATTPRPMPSGQNLSANAMSHQQGMSPPHSQGMPAHQHGMPPPHQQGMPPPHQQGMPPPHQQGMPPPHQQGMPSPHQQGMPPPHQQGMLPPHQQGMPPHQQGMPPSHQQGIPPPPHQQGMPPPHQQGIPPPPHQQGIPPPHQQGMSPPHQQGMPPLHQQGMPSPPGKGYSPSSDMYHANSGAPLMGPTPGYPVPHQPVSGPGYHAGGLQQPSQPARRLDPDQMPSPIQVMQDDQRNRSGVFYTNQKGLVPPLVTTNFITHDQGNVGPRFIRSSMYNVPATIDMMKQTAVPFGLVVSPLAKVLPEEYPPPIVNMGDLGPVRCNRCKAYMCPFMQFIDGGRRFHCLFCKATTEVPGEYFQHLDHTGQRVDRYERPELLLGAYEFVATKDYCRNNTFPLPPALVFVIDVSYNNIKSGMVHLLCANMKEILKLLPKEEGTERSTMRVGFITYNNTVHFYNVKGCLAQPQMMVVGDVQDMFMPLLEGFLCDPVESEAVVDSLMEQIPAMFADTRETETILAPAIQAGLEALKASECSGKLLVFHSSLPIAEAPGKLKNRDDRKLLGTEKEKSVLVPQVNTYNNLGQECVGVGCSVDLFIFNNSYIDLATIGQVSRLTGGEIFKYTYFQADLDGERLITDIKRDVSRPIAFDAIMRVRTSTGVRATDFYGHFFMSNTTDMELAAIDCDKAVALEIKHDDKLTEEGVYIQVALLYTSCGGQRRLRVLNLSLKTCSQMADLYRTCDLDTIVNFFSKQSVFRLFEASPKPVKENLLNRCAQMLACYRKNCASPSSAGQLILPECMKLLPLYVNCILKSDAVSGGSDMTIDDRWFVMQTVTIMDIPSSVVFFYPRLLPLHDIDVNCNDIPSSIRCSSDKLRDDGVYLLENGIHMFLWIGLNVSMEWMQNVFGVHSAAQIDIDRTSLLEIDNPLSQRIRELIDAIRSQRHRSMRLTLVRQRDKLEMVFKHFLMEDRGIDGSASYVDFLCHMHKEIRNLLS